MHCALIFGCAALQGLTDREVLVRLQYLEVYREEVTQNLFTDNSNLRPLCILVAGPRSAPCSSRAYPPPTCMRTRFEICCLEMRSYLAPFD